MYKIRRANDRGESKLPWLDSKHTFSFAPNKMNIKPQYEQKEFPKEDKMNKLCLIASPTGIEDSFKIQQNIDIYQTYLEEGNTLPYSVLEYRKIWIHLAQGEVLIGNITLSAGDGLAIENEQQIIDIKGVAKESNIIIFDMDANVMQY